MVCARIAEIVIRNEESVLPIGSYHADYGVTFSLPSILNCKGIRKVLIPSMSEEEKLALQHCAMVLKNSLNH